MELTGFGIGLMLGVVAIFGIVIILAKADRVINEHEIHNLKERIDTVLAKADRVIK
jgi:hypothetical protein